MKRIIAIVAGGDSSEFEVSLRSAEGIYGFLDKDKYEVFIVEFRGADWRVNYQGELLSVDKNDFSFLYQGRKIKFDYAYITIHGTPGEDGKVQGYFDMLKIPYSTCGVLQAAMTFDKFVCSQYLKSFGFTFAESILVREGDKITARDIEEKIGFPCFIKPNYSGSSFGVTRVDSSSQVDAAIEKAKKEGGSVLIESFIDGTEVTCGCYKVRGEITPLPITEVVTMNDFFDYDAKYNGEVEEITPARISNELTERVQKITTAIYNILGCSGIIRADYIITKENVITLLEVNTTPGMTKTSFIPQQVAAAGIQMKDLLTAIIEEQFQ